MTYTVEDIVRRYIELRDKKAQINDMVAKQLDPINKKLEALEAVLHDMLNKAGADSMKTPAGTPYKTELTSVTTEDMDAFKNYVLQPAVESVMSYMEAAGHPLNERDATALLSIIKSDARWSLTDFRAGKKGVQDHVELNDEIPPGIKFNRFEKINVKRS